MYVHVLLGIIVIDVIIRGGDGVGSLGGIDVLLLLKMTTPFSLARILGGATVLQFAYRLCVM